MSQLDWSPRKISHKNLTLLCIVAGFFLVAVYGLPIVNQNSNFEEKWKGIQKSKESYSLLKKQYLEHNPSFSLETDPLQTGLIGSFTSPITSNLGSLQAKQTSLDFRFILYILDQFSKLQLQPGDRVAVGLSGSFPGLNIHLYSALYARGLKPVIISSPTSSQWGANNPDFTWLDMDNFLFENSIYPFCTQFASLGGIEDRGDGISEEGKKIILSKIQKYNLNYLNSKNLKDSIKLRMQTYEKESQNQSYKAYINIGGGATSVGTYIGKKSLRPGINLELTKEMKYIDSVAIRFLQKGIPVLHLSSMESLSKQMGILPSEITVEMNQHHPSLVDRRPNRWLAGFGAGILMIFLLGVRIWTKV